VVNFGSDDVTVISGTSVVTTLAVGRMPSAVDVDPTTGYVYVANREGRSITVISEGKVGRDIRLPLIMKNSK
jgi:DNA-binding beta-propeller fold protein YncE